MFPLFNKPATLSINIDIDRILRFQNGCNKMVIEFGVVQFWSDFKITCMISVQIALHPVQLPLFIATFSTTIPQLSLYVSGL